MDFRNNMQKVYVTDEQKEKFMEKLNKDVEVAIKCLLNMTIGVIYTGNAGATTY